MVYYYIFIYNGKWMCTWGAPRAVYQFVCPGAELLETSVRMSYRAPGVVVCGVFWGSAAVRLRLKLGLLNFALPPGIVKYPRK